MGRKSGKVPGKPSGISSSGALSPPKTCVSRHDATLLCDDCDPLPGADDGIVRRWLWGGVVAVETGGGEWGRGRETTTTSRALLRPSRLRRKKRIRENKVGKEEKGKKYGSYAQHKALRKDIVP